MARLTVDIEQLVVGLLAESFPGVAVMSEVDSELDDRIPAIIVSPGTGVMVENGHPGGGWSWSVTANVIERGHGAASDLADQVYQAMHRFEDNQASIPGVGCVNHTEDVQMPVRTATVADLDHLTQFTGIWSLIVSDS